MGFGVCFGVELTPKEPFLLPGSPAGAAASLLLGGKPSSKNCSFHQLSVKGMLKPQVPAAAAGVAGGGWEGLAAPSRSFCKA